MTFLAAGTSLSRTCVARHFPASANCPCSSRLDLFHALLGRQLEHLQILDDSRPFAVVGHQPVVGRSKHRAGIERLPVPVMDESSGLAQERPDDVTEVHQRAPVPAQPRQAKQKVPRQIHLQLGLVQFHPQRVPNQTRGHRIGVLPDPNQTVRTDYRFILPIFGQTPRRQRTHQRQLFGQSASGAWRWPPAPPPAQTGHIPPARRNPGCRAKSGAAPGAASNAGSATPHPHAHGDRRR